MHHVLTRVAETLKSQEESHIVLVIWTIRYIYL